MHTYCRSVLCSFLVSPSLIFIPIMSLSNFLPGDQTMDTQTEAIDFVSCLLEYAPPPTLIPLRCVPTHSSVSFDVQGHTCLIAEFRALFNFTQQNEHDLTMSTYLECSNLTLHFGSFQWELHNHLHFSMHNCVISFSLCAQAWYILHDHSSWF